MKYVCQNCGDTTQGEPEWDNWDCVVCGGDVAPNDESGVVAKDDLRGLIDEWRNGTLPREGTFNQAADQLEELIDDE